MFVEFIIRNNEKGHPINKQDLNHIHKISLYVMNE